VSKLKELRAGKNLSQAELARQAKVSQRTISYLETGDRAPSARVLFRLAKALDVPLDTFEADYSDDGVSTHAPAGCD
jgi:putative transcriptional regulator